MDVTGFDIGISSINDIPAALDSAVTRLSRIMYRFGMDFNEEELSTLEVAIASPAVSGLDTIYNLLADVQRVRDRCLGIDEALSIIESDTSELLSILEECLEVLRTAHLTETMELKSDKLRISFLRQRYPDFFKVYWVANTFNSRVKSAINIVRRRTENIESTNKNLSRQLTTIQMRSSLDPKDHIPINYGTSTTSRPRMPGQPIT